MTQSHPLLIYKKPFSKGINENSQTIGLHEAINFLENEGYDISEKFKEDLEWIKKLRNSIEHHKFSMDVEKVEKTIGRLMIAVDEFDKNYEDIDLSLYVSSNKYELFHALANTYKRRVKSVEVLLDDVPDYMMGILRCSSVVSKNDTGDVIEDHQNLIDNREYHSWEELVEDIARRLDVDPEIVCRVY